MSMKKWLSISLLVLIIGFACKHEPIEPDQIAVIDTSRTEDSITFDWRPDPKDPCDQNKVYFEQDVFKLIVTKCAMFGITDSEDEWRSCHGGSFDESDYVNLTSYDSIVKYLSPTVRDNDTLESIIDVISDNEMPPQDSILGLHPLSTAEKNIILKWYNDGFPNSSCYPCQENSEVDSNDVIQILYDNCSGCHHTRDKSVAHFFKFPPKKENAIMFTIKRELNTIITRTTPTSNNTGLMPYILPSLLECEVNTLKEYQKKIE